MTKDQLFSLAMAKVKENDHLAAIKAFTKVLEIDPKDANSLSHRGIAYLNLEQYELALKDMNAAVEFDPEYSFRYQSRAYLKTRLKDHEGAIRDYEKAVELDPSDGIALNNLALAQEQMGWNQHAKQNFDKSDKMMGVKTVEERAKERQLVAETKVTENNDSPNKKEIAKSVFTKKSVFKEFIQFIKNGFKLGKNE